MMCGEYAAGLCVQVPIPRQTPDLFNSNNVRIVVMVVAGVTGDGGAAGSQEGSWHHPGDGEGM